MGGLQTLAARARILPQISESGHSSHGRTNANSPTDFKVSSAQKLDPENLQTTVVLQDVNGSIGLEFGYWRCEAAYQS